MNNFFKNKIYLFVLVYSLTMIVTYAQTNPPAPTGPGLDDLPIDGGLILLSLAAISYGIIKKK